MAVEFLKGRILKVTEIEVMDGQVIDQKFGNLQQLGRYLLRFADCFVPYEVYNILSKRQNHHVEPRWRLEMILFIIFLLLGVKCSKS